MLRFARTVTEATVRRYHYENRKQIETHLTAFLNAYNFAKRLKTPGGLTPFEAICKAWGVEPKRFLRDPDLLASGLNTKPRAAQALGKLRKRSSLRQNATAP